MSWCRITAAPTSNRAKPYLIKELEGFPHFKDEVHWDVLLTKVHELQLVPLRDDRLIPGLARADLFEAEETNQYIIKKADALGVSQ